MTDHFPEVVTPTEELILEVLAARNRLGERLWTFDSRHKHSLERLQRRGLIQTMHGIVERTLRASLTEAGAARCLDPDYAPPSDFCKCGHADHLHYKHGRCSVEEPRVCPCVNLTYRRTRDEKRGEV